MQRHSRYLALLITKLAKRTDIYSDSGVEGLLSLVLLISLGESEFSINILKKIGLISEKSRAVPKLESKVYIIVI